MIFVCAECRLSGRDPEECDTCIKVRAKLKDMPPYEPPEVMPAQMHWSRPEQHPQIVREDEERFRQEYAEAKRIEYAKIEKWWAHFHEVHKPSYGVYSDPELGFECFNDFTVSPELRTKMREQVALAIFSMPDDEWMPVNEEDRRRKIWKIRKH